MRTTSELPVMPRELANVPASCGNGHDEVAPTAEPNASWHRTSSLIYSRKTHRVPFTGALTIRGLDENLNPVDSEFAAKSRDISADGISFRHEGPLPYRFVELSYQTARGPVTRRVRLTWCRYSAEGSYVSGGRFLRD